MVFPQLCRCSGTFIKFIPICCNNEFIIRMCLKLKVDQTHVNPPLFLLLIWLQRFGSDVKGTYTAFYMMFTPQRYGWLLTEIALRGVCDDWVFIGAFFKTGSRAPHALLFRT